MTGTELNITSGMGTTMIVGIGDNPRMQVQLDPAVAVGACVSRKLC